MCHIDCRWRVMVSFGGYSVKRPYGAQTLAGLHRTNRNPQRTIDVALWSAKTRHYLTRYRAASTNLTKIYILPLFQIVSVISKNPVPDFITGIGSAYGR